VSCGAQDKAEAKAEACFAFNTSTYLQGGARDSKMRIKKSGNKIIHRQADARRLCDE
jgi:hypothetical protein